MKRKIILSFVIITLIQNNLIASVNSNLFNNNPLTPIITYKDSLKKGFDYHSIFDELTLSFNRNDEARYNEYSAHDYEFNMLGFGFGVGLNHTFIKSEHFKLLLGLAYNQNNQYRERITNVNYIYEIKPYTPIANNRVREAKIRLNTITMPLTFRVDPFNKSNFFIEIGSFIDLPLKTRVSGTQFTINEWSDSYGFFQWDLELLEFNDKFRVANINYGATFGIGTMITLNKNNLIIKADYKYGLNELADYDTNFESDPLRNSYYRLSIGIRRK